MNRTLVIAEAGVNHNGDPKLALELVEMAAAAGADLVKFQTFSAERLVAPDAAKARYQARATDAEETQLEMLERLELSEEVHHELIARCRALGIGFFSTGFDEQSVDFLVDCGLEILKVPSGEITNGPYLSHVGRQSKQVILSTGMATIGEVSNALEVLEQSGTPRSKITVLHCTSAYPTPMDEVNLNAMVTLKRQLNVAVGYSDHTLGTEVAVAAVALGATVIEKHFTLDSNMAGPDHQASLEPEELRTMVAGIRNIERALGDGRKRVSKSEEENRRVARKSLVAARAIRAGEAFDHENVAIMRPGTGISPMRYNEVIGCAAPRDFSRHEPIEL